MIDLAKSFATNRSDDVEEQSKDDNGNYRKDDDADRLGHRAAGVEDAASKHKTPEVALQIKFRQKHSPGDQGTACKKLEPQ